MKKVLIVEDELVLVFALKQYIHRIGYTVVDTVADGLTAIESAKENQPDIILMDIQIRGTMDGIETVAQIRKFSQAPVIFTADRYEMHIHEQAAVTENACLLYKPVQNTELKELIDFMVVNFSY